MIEAKIKLYSFGELAENVQDKLIAKNRYNYLFPFDESLRHIEKLGKRLNLTIEYDSRSYIDFQGFGTDGIDDDILELNGKRAVAYIYNNYIKPNMANYYRYLYNNDTW